MEEYCASMPKTMSLQPFTSCEFALDPTEACLCGWREHHVMLELFARNERRELLPVSPALWELA